MLRFGVIEIGAITQCAALQLGGNLISYLRQFAPTELLNCRWSIEG